MTNTRTRLIAALFVLGAITIGLHVLGAWADLTLSQWRVWTDQTTDAVTGIVRLLALALSYYLIVVLVALLLLGDQLRGHRLEKLVPYGMLGALGLVAGVGVLTASTASPPIASPPIAHVASVDVAPLTLRESAAPLTLTEMANSSEPSQEFTYTPHGQTTAVGETWDVKSGETLWSIAQETLQDAWGVEDITDEQIVSYWEPLIEANQDRLVEPGNPDLILPGQQLVIPEPPAPPAS